MREAAKETDDKSCQAQPGKIRTAEIGRPLELLVNILLVTCVEVGLVKWDGCKCELTQKEL